MRSGRSSGKWGAARPYQIAALAAAGALMGACGPSAAQPTCQEQADATWTKFRAAILAKDATAAAALTHFPLAVRGELDDSPTTRIGAAAFKARFGALIAQDTGVRVNGDYPLTQLAADTPRIKTPKCDAPDADFHVGQLTFTRVNGAWKLSTIYAEE